MQEGDAKVRQTPWSVPLRIGLPLLTFTGIALLLASHCSPGVITRAEGHAPFNALEPHEVNRDNLVSAVRRLAKSQCWGLVIVVAFMSGLMPYLKMLSTLAVTFLVDRHLLPVPTALAIYSWLEVFGKWSFADVVLICLNYLCFDIDSPEHVLGAFGRLKLHIFVQIQFGALEFMLAVVCSLLTNTWAKQELEALSASSEPLVSAERKAPPPSWHVGLAALAGIVTAILVVVGSSLPVIIIRRSGFMANLLAEKDRDLRLSLFTFAMGLDSSTPSAGLQVIAFCVIFLVPLCEAVLLVGISLAAHVQARIAFAATRIVADWCKAFSTLEVFMIICVVAMFQLPKMVEFEVGSECAPFEGLMNNTGLLKIVGLDDAADDSCFALSSGFMVGFWVLVVAQIFRFIAWQLVFTLPVPPGRAEESKGEIEGAKV